MTKSPKTKEERRLTLQLVLAVSMAIFGSVLIIVAFLVPPTGEIHPSVLTAFGEIATFSGALIGVDYRYRFKEFEIERKTGRQEAEENESE